MEILKRKLSLVSFPDFAVISWRIDIGERCMVIMTDGAFLDEGDGQSFVRAELSFSKWKWLCFRYFDAHSEKWHKCSYDYDALKDICEFDVSEAQIKLRGFGRRTGQWIEIEITGGAAAINLY